MTGTLVGSGGTGLRYSAGASGFMPEAPMCDAQPLNQMRIADSATRRPGAAAAYATGGARLAASGPSPPAARNVRRSGRGSRPSASRIDATPSTRVRYQPPVAAPVPELLYSANRVESTFGGPTTRQGAFER